jgi:dihydrofolate synthase/folylpolyglutamate synthase
MAMDETAPGYAEALAFLSDRIDFERIHTPTLYMPEFKLQRTRLLLERLGNPQEQFQIVHVAGTKGKGSTATMIGSVLAKCGYRTGLYTSPHLERIEERFIVDGQAVNTKQFVELVDRMRPIVSQLDCQEFRHGERQAPTYFELSTAMAFLHFAQTAVDVAVVEVGLGGRLDSTNVCRPLVSVITSIGLDHTQQLGDTLEEIAFEKAGIIKPGVPTISGVTQGGPRHVILDICRERSSNLYQVDRDFHWQAQNERMTYTSTRDGDFGLVQDVEVGLIGRHQLANAAVAIATLSELASQSWSIPVEAVRAGLRDVRCPGRVEVMCREPLVILDTAHNVPSTQALAATLEEGFIADRKVLIFAASRDKDAPGMLQSLIPWFDEVILTEYVSARRALPAEQLAEIAAGLGYAKCLTCKSPEASWHHAWSNLGPGDLVCVSGSFFLAGELRRVMENSLAARPRLMMRGEATPAASQLPKVDVSV